MFICLILICWIPSKCQDCSNDTITIFSIIKIVLLWFITYNNVFFFKNCPVFHNSPFWHSDSLKLKFQSLARQPLIVIFGLVTCYLLSSKIDWNRHQRHNSLCVISRLVKQPLNADCEQRACGGLFCTLHPAPQQGNILMGVLGRNVPISR